MPKAYAKINLALSVTGIKDQYHTLQMINCKINLFDSIKISKAFKTKIVYDRLRIKKEDDTLYKMVMDLKYIYPVIPNLLIRIKKRIPVQAGLGGMSSDASAILIYLNKKYNLRLSIKRMQKFLLNYGTDMCYTLYDEPCIVEGIGEIVKPIELDLPKKVIVLYPNLKIATKDVFTNVLEFSKPMDLNDLNELHWHDLAPILKNDLEPTVCKMYPEMKDIIETLRANIKAPVVMSGSGSTIIIYSGSKKIMKKIKKTYPNYLVGIKKIINKEHKQNE